MILKIDLLVILFLKMQTYKQSKLIQIIFSLKNNYNLIENNNILG